MSGWSSENARSFGAVADDYDRFRPTYAAEAVLWALGERPLRVADIGAGTGILSRLLQRLGHEVVAVEPDDQMRRRLVEASPGVTALAGSAEDIPLADGSMDAVVAGQSYHWFDPERAHPEIVRVLRPGGVFAAMWNDADMEVPWTVRYVEIVDGSAVAVFTREVSDFGVHFGPAMQGEFRHDMPMTVDGLVALAATRSPYLVAGEQGRREMVAAIRAMAAEHGLAGVFPMPHVTRVHRAERRASLQGA